MAKKSRKPKDINKKIEPSGDVIEESNEQDQTSISERLDNIEAMLKSKDLEGSLDFEGEETESQMFTVSSDFKDPVTGVPISFLTKTRTSDYYDVDKQIWPYAQAYYNQLGKVRDGGAFVFIPLEDIEDGKVNINDYAGCRIYEKPEGYTVIIYMSWVIERLRMLARISSFDGYSRKEAIHIKGGEAFGQGYIESHAPPPPIYPKEKGGKAPYQKLIRGSNKKLEAAEDAVFEEPNEQEVK